MNGEICIGCKKPMGNSGCTDRNGRPLHARCKKEMEDSEFNGVVKEALK